MTEESKIRDLLTIWCVVDYEFIRVNKVISP